MFSVACMYVITELIIWYCVTNQLCHYWGRLILSSLSNCQLFSSLSSWRSIGDFSPSILLCLLLSLFGSFFFFRQAHDYNIMYIAWCLSLKTKAPSRLSWTFWYLFLYSILFLRLLNFNPMIFLIIDYAVINTHMINFLLILCGARYREIYTFVIQLFQHIHKKTTLHCLAPCLKISWTSI